MRDDILVQIPPTFQKPSKIKKGRRAVHEQNGLRKLTELGG